MSDTDTTAPGPGRPATMTELISAVEAVDVRFPTSRELDGSDAMNPEPDYWSAYVTIRTSGGDEGDGLAFTVGRGNDVEVAAVRALPPLVVGLPVEDVLNDLGDFSRRLTGDSQLRWLGPEKGAIHMAAAAIVNAVWDLYGRRTGQPVWRLLSELSPEQLVDLVDFRYLEDALTREEALEILRRAEPGRAERTAHLLEHGEHAHNQVMLKQLLQAGALDILQMDASRTPGVTENVAILLLAAKFGVPVCPHAGGVGLCEMAQHLAMFDHIAVSASTENRVIEYVDHLHEHFTDPVRIRDGHYLAPTAPGISARLHPASVAAHRYPDGPVRQGQAGI